jgi:hypothetical protein
MQSYLVNTKISCWVWTFLFHPPEMKTMNEEGQRAQEIVPESPAQFDLSGKVGRSVISPPAT